MYLRDNIFVTDVSVPAVETIKLARVKTGLSETVSFLKTFGYLYDAFEIGEKKYVREKGNIEDADKVCIEVQKTSDNAGGKPTRGFSLHSTQNISCFELRPRLWKLSEGIA